MTVTYSQTSVYHNLCIPLTPMRYDSDLFLTNLTYRRSGILC